MSDDLDDIGMELMSDKAPKKAKKKEPSESKKKVITFEMGEDVGARDMEAAVKMVGKMTKDIADSREKDDAARAQYKKEGHRRWICEVESLRAGVKTFQLHVPHPNNPDKPVLVQGRCNVRLTKGLTMYAIKALEYSHHWRTEEIPQDPKLQMGLTVKQVKVPHFRVVIEKEIENPPEFGNIYTPDEVSRLRDRAAALAGVNKEEQL